MKRQLWLKMLDSDGDEIIYDLSRAHDGFIEFYRGIGLAIARMNRLR